MYRQAHSESDGVHSAFTENLVDIYVHICTYMHTYQCTAETIFRNKIHTGRSVASTSKPVPACEPKKLSLSLGTDHTRRDLTPESCLLSST